MSFEKGAKVQALDELGRWEEARIIEKDGLNYEVNFVGWGSRFNRVLNSDDVRDIVDPFKTAVQTGSHVTRKRRVNPASSEQLHHLKMLTRGETTTFIDAEGQEVIAEVVTVDKFRKEIEVSLGDCGLSTIVPVHALKVTEPEHTLPKEKRRKHQGSTRKTSHEAVPMQRNEAETQTDLCDKVGQGGTHYPLVFQSGELIHSGGTVTLKTHPNTIFGVTRIFHKGTGIVARGELVINSSIDRDVEITAPVQKLQCVKVPLTKKDKDHLSKFNIADNSELQRSLLDAPPEVREQVRASQLGAAVAREVHFALKSKNAKRRFCLGLCSFEHDLSILGFGSARKVVFSYRESNISKLDSLLGQQWDVFSFDANQFKFVTQVVFRLREQIISGTIYTSVSRSELTPSYRQCLADTDLAVPVIEEDENSDQEEV